MPLRLMSEARRDAEPGTTRAAPAGSARQGPPRRRPGPSRRLDSPARSSRQSTCLAPRPPRLWHQQRRLDRRDLHGCDRWSQFSADRRGLHDDRRARRHRPPDIDDGARSSGRSPMRPVVTDFLHYRQRFPRASTLLLVTSGLLALGAARLGSARASGADEARPRPRRPGHGHWGIAEWCCHSGSSVHAAGCRTSMSRPRIMRGRLRCGARDRPPAGARLCWPGRTDVRTPRPVDARGPRAAAAGGALARCRLPAGSDLSTRVRNYGDGCPCRCTLWPAREFGEQPREVAAREGPLKGLGRLGMAHLKLEEAILDGGERREVVRGEDFAMDDREVDLELVGPTGVNGVCTIRLDRWPAASGGAGPSVGGAVVDDPEHAASGPIGFLTHDLCDQAIEGSAAGLGFAAAKRLARCKSHARRRPRPPPRRTPTSPRIAWLGEVAPWGAGDAGPGCWSSRPRIRRTRGGRAGRHASGVGTDPGSARLCARTPGHAGRSTSGTARAGARPG